MKSFILVLALITSTTLLAAPLNYTLKSSNKSALKNQISYTHNWTNTEDLDNLQKDFLGIGAGSEKREVLISSFNFYLPKSMEKFKGKYFQNMRLLEQLSGMNYKKGSGEQIHNISFKPHPLKTITAVGRINLVTDTRDIEDVFSLVPNEKQIVVHQTVSKFSDYFDRTDIVTQIVDNGEGTHFTIYSVAILNVDESNSTLLGVTKTAMLSKLKDQMKLTPEVFYNN